MGIVERPSEHSSLALKEYGFAVPREHGVYAIPAIEDMLGNPGRFLWGWEKLAQATSDTYACHEALRSCAVTVYFDETQSLSFGSRRRGLDSLLYRQSEMDEQSSGKQFITVEDSMGIVHKAKGISPSVTQFKSDIDCGRIEVFPTIPM